MPNRTYHRLLALHDGDMSLAYEHVCNAYEEVCCHVSVGKMRAGPATDRAAKQQIEGIDVDHTASPHG